MVLLGMFLSMWIHFCWDYPENGVTGSQEVVVASSLVYTAKESYGVLPPVYLRFLQQDPRIPTSPYSPKPGVANLF